MNRCERLRNKLYQHMSFAHLSIIDESHEHHGHAGFGKESHLRILAVSADFQGKSLVERSRLIFSIANEEFQQGLHALSLQTLTPEEWVSRGGSA